MDLLDLRKLSDSIRYYNELADKHLLRHDQYREKALKLSIKYAQQITKQSNHGKL